MEGGREGGREGERREERRERGGRKGGRKGGKNPTIIFCPPLVLCRALLHWSTSIRSLFSVSFIVSIAVITSGLPAWRHFRRVEERVGLWVRVRGE